MSSAIRRITALTSHTIINLPIISFLLIAMLMSELMTVLIFNYQHFLSESGKVHHSEKKKDSRGTPTSCFIRYIGKNIFNAMSQKSLPTICS